MRPAQGAHPMSYLRWGGLRTPPDVGAVPCRESAPCTLPGGLCALPGGAAAQVGRWQQEEEE